MGHGFKCSTKAEIIIFMTCAWVELGKTNQTKLRKSYLSQIYILINVTARNNCVFTFLTSNTVSKMNQEVIKVWETIFWAILHKKLQSNRLVLGCSLKCWIIIIIIIWGGNLIYFYVNYDINHNLFLATVHCLHTKGGDNHDHTTVMNDLWQFSSTCGYQLMVNRANFNAALRSQICLVRLFHDRPSINYEVYFIM